jgi:hypothetical protein
MFIEVVLIGTLTVQAIRHDQSHQPHLHRAVDGEFPAAFQRGGYALSNLAAPSALSALSGWIMTLPTLTP